MGIRRSFSHYQIVASAPGSRHRWIESLDPAGLPFDDWASDSHLVIQETCPGPALDADRVLAGFHDLGAASRSFPIRLAGLQPVARGHSWVLVVPVEPSPELRQLEQQIQQVLGDRWTGLAGPDGITRPYLPVIENLAADQVDPVRWALLRTPYTDEVMLDRLHLLGCGPAGWSFDLGSVRLGRSAPGAVPRPPLLRHARGWRRASGW